MTPLPERQTAARGRSIMMAIAAMAVLMLIAIVAVVAFVRLELVSAPPVETGAEVVGPPIVAPAPTHIRPELFAPPNAWLDEVG